MLIMLIFWVFILLIAFLGLKWLVQENDGKLTDKFEKGKFFNEKRVNRRK